MSVDNTPESTNAPPALTAPAVDAAKPRHSPLALLALAVALLTAGYVLYRDPPWGRLGKYNFSGPEQALRSNMRIQADGDVRALIELQSKLRRKEGKERLATLEVKRTAECDGKTALFVQYVVANNGDKEPKERKGVEWYERDEGSGYWRRAFVDPGKVRQADPQLAKDIDAWTSRFTFGMSGIED